MCLLGLRNGAFPVLAGPLTFRFASKANMTGSRQGGLLQFHQWEGEGVASQIDRMKTNSLGCEANVIPALFIPPFIRICSK